MRNPLTNVIFLSILALIAITAIFIINYSPGNLTGSVVVEYEEVYSLGESLSGTLSITIDQEERLPANTPMVISLSQEDKVIEVETLILKEFIDLSNKPIEPKSGFYDVPGTYSLEVSKVIPYTFNEKGEYELFFNIISLDITSRQRITVN